jgi:hypothetical protein
MWPGIPDPTDFESEHSSLIPVPSSIVENTIDLLYSVLAQVRAEEGGAPDHAVWDQIVAATAQALAGLLNARGVHYHRGGARELVDQIAWFCHWDDVPKRLGALGGPPREREAYTGLRDTDVVAALLSLHELSQRRLAERRQERKESQRKQQPTGEQGPLAESSPRGSSPAAEPEPAAPDRDLGWEF